MQEIINNNHCDTRETTFSPRALVVFFLIGILFGITMSKSEALSWFRIYEMFRFESFHMYGIIGTALFFGVLMTWSIKKYAIKDFRGQYIFFTPKDKTYKRYLFGGIIFGLGWAMSGACPGPMFTLLGHGVLAFIIVILSALFGTFTYGLLKDKLPH